MWRSRRHTGGVGGHEGYVSTPPAPADSGEDRFRAAYRCAYADLLRFVTRRVHPSHAEDVVADVFLVAWRRVVDLPVETDDQRAWLFGIARNTLLGHHRSGRRREALAVRIAQHPPTGGDVDPDLIATRVDLARVWPSLPADQQEVIALTVWDGLDGPGAARVLGVTAVAYRLRLSRARRTLRRLLDLPSPSAARSVALPEGTSS